MTNMNTRQIEAKIDALEDEIDDAKARSDTTKAQKLYEEQYRLYQALPGGTDPAVGEGGRTI